METIWTSTLFSIGHKWPRQNSPFNINTTSIRQVMRIKKNISLRIFLLTQCQILRGGIIRIVWQTVRSKGITDEILGVEGLRGVGIQASSNMYNNFLLHNWKVQIYIKGIARGGTGSRGASALQPPILNQTFFVTFSQTQCGGWRENLVSNL